MKKRFVSLLAGGVLAASALAGFTACGGGDKVQLTVWGSAAQQDTLKEMVAEFEKANPDTKYDIKVGIGEEDMAYSNVSKDPSAAADVYCYSNDQLIPLLRVGALAELGGIFLTEVERENSAESVAAGTIDYGAAGKKVYGYPYASDNGYFMYYDKSVISETQATSLESIISTCEAANKKIGWALDVPWYVAGWFFTFGGEYSVNYDNNDNYKEGEVTINFNDPDVGLKASKAMAKLTSSSAFYGKQLDDSKLITGFNTKQIAVGISGTWNAKTLQEKLGANYGVCKLPTVNVDGTDKQMYSFKGYKLMGVNPHSKNLVEAHKLASFLTDGDMQKVRFEKHLIGPTNTTVANLDAVKNDPTFAALSAQNTYAVNQTSVPSNFWEPLKNYGLYIIDGAIDEAGTNGAEYTYQNYLDNMVTSIKNK